MTGITFHVVGLEGLVTLLERDVDGTKMDLSKAHTKLERAYLDGYRDALSQAVWMIQHTELVTKQDSE